jgi:hypothetical protein
MSKTVQALMTMGALGGWEQPAAARDPFVCFADPDMMGDDYLGDDYLGDDYLGDETVGDETMGAVEDILGAAAARYAQRGRRRGRRGGAGRRPMQMQRATPRLGAPLHARPPWRDGQAAPGVNQPSENLLPFGFRDVTGVGTPFVFNAAGGIAKVFQAQPQKPVRPERLVMNVRRVGASTAGLIVSLNGFQVGADNQLVGLQGEVIDAETFATNGFGIRMSNSQAQPGILITLSLQLVGGLVVAPDFITVVPTYLARAII